MNFSIRDDDSNYFTKSDDLESVYGKIWDICPISISIVPFHACTRSGAIPKKYWVGNETFPIGENEDLVKFIKIKIIENKISLMLHGYSHENFENGYEFEVGDDLFIKIKKGKGYLQDVFNVVITTFVPPHNTLSKDGLQAVIKNGLNLLAIPSFKFNKRSFRFTNIVPFIKNKFCLLRYKNDYPHVLDFGNHKELACCSITPTVSFETIRSRFDFCYRMNGSFCLATHHWELANDKKMRKAFEMLWDYANQKDKIEYCEADKLFI